MKLLDDLKHTFNTKTVQDAVDEARQAMEDLRQEFIMYGYLEQELNDQSSMRAAKLKDLDYFG